MIKKEYGYDKSYVNRRLVRMLIMPILIMGMLCACSERDSGLYRVNIEEDGTTEEAGTEAAATDTGTGDREEYLQIQAVDSGTDASGKTGEAGNFDTPVEAAETETSDEPAFIYVHVCGHVNRPGVYEMTGGDRIFQAVEAAGGFKEDASEDYVNLAMPLSDGMKITIPAEAEIKEYGEEEFLAVEYPQGKASEQTSDAMRDKTSASGSGAPDGFDSGDAGDSGRININTADEATLMTISGIGQSKARAIIAYREDHGGFGTVEEIKNVSGIGDSTYNRFKDEITVGTRQ